ncbi:MAG: carboxypeptidase M32 [Bullifex sp.]
MRKELGYLKSQDEKVVRLGSVLALLSWDMETILPEKAIEERSRQMGLISTIKHEEATKDELRRAVEALSGDETLSDADKGLVRAWKRFFRTEANLSSELVREISEAEGNAHFAWVEARACNDYSIFAPHLENLIGISRKVASVIAPEKKCYDALLDMYEEGMDMATLDPVFDDLEKSTHELMDKTEGKNPDTSFLREKYDEKALHEFCLGLSRRMGFDTKRGTTAISAHPFTTSLGSDDVRITTRYTDPSVFDPIASMVHETGHALYDSHANLNPEIRGTSIGQGVSMGIHESQSRFWENMMGRSFAFWQYCYPELQHAVPSLKQVSLDDFYRAINIVEPSAIRVNADEATYNLHIILRYRMEKAIFEEGRSVSELPELWNTLSREVIRYEVKNDSEGILQDSHWAGGMFGYFPTYSLGNLHAAAFLKKMTSDLGGSDRVDEILRSGNWSPITSWQDENIWSKGGIYTPSDLVRSVTGKSLDAAPFKEYLIDKYSRIYQL